MDRVANEILEGVVSDIGELLFSSERKQGMRDWRESKSMADGWNARESELQQTPDDHRGREDRVGKFGM